MPNSRLKKHAQQQGKSSTKKVTEQKRGEVKREVQGTTAPMRDMREEQRGAVVFDYKTAV